MTTRRELLLTTGALLVAPLAGSLAAQAQPAVRMHRIGFLSPLSAVPEPPTLQGFRQGLRELGYVEGKTVIVETRFGEGRPELLPGLVADLLRLKVDVLTIGSDIAVLAAKRATSTVPIVFAGVSDPVGSGLVTSIARPGGNITGVTFGVGGEGFSGKWVELLKETVPGLSRVAVLSSSTDPQTAPIVREIQAAARKLNVKLQEFDAVNAADLDLAFAAIDAGRVQGIIVANSAFFAAYRVKITQFAASKRLPAMYFFRLFPDVGGLMSYGGSLVESYRRAATFVDKILKGAKPADLSIEQPTKIELVINLKTARSLGLTIPQSVLLRADETIE